MFFIMLSQYSFLNIKIHVLYPNMKLGCDSTHAHAHTHTIACVVEKYSHGSLFLNEKFLIVFSFSSIYFVFKN